MKRNLTHTIGDRSGPVLDMIRTKAGLVCNYKLLAYYEEYIWDSFHLSNSNSVGDEISINLGIPITMFCR